MLFKSNKIIKKRAPIKKLKSKPKDKQCDEKVYLRNRISSQTKTEAIDYRSKELFHNLDVYTKLISHNAEAIDALKEVRHELESLLKLYSNGYIKVNDCLGQLEIIEHQLTKVMMDYTQPASPTL